MSLAEKLNNTDVGKRQFCSVGFALERLSTEARDDADLTALIGALESGTSWPATDLAELMIDEGLPVNFRHIRQHRKGHGLRECVEPTLGRVKK